MTITESLPKSAVRSDARHRGAKKMTAAIVVEPGRIELEDWPIPDVGPLDALVRITLTTICGTDVHILKGEHPVAKG